jgi:hypothetical protein
MALPIWITPAGGLGILPELEYYEYVIDAYDESGGALVYSKISGKLPLGIQLIPTGKLQGIPVSELGGDQNVSYKFTLRAKNSVTGGIADRTFTIAVSNVVPPIITPRDVDLGLYFDGTIINIQLAAIESTPGAKLTWRLKSGTLPPGLVISSTGLLYGYIRPIANPNSSTPGWDQTPWNQFGWDFSITSISKTFEFSVEVTDGVNYDATPYVVLVVPQNSFQAGSTGFTADATVSSGEPLTIDIGSRNAPIIITTQQDIPPERQGSYFALQILAVDLNDDVLRYALPAIAAGAFDEQSAPADRSYITSTVEGGNLSVAVNSISDNSRAALLPGDNIKVLSLTTIDNLNWYNAIVTNFISMTLTGNTIISGAPGDFITQAIGSANAIVSSISTTSGSIALTGNVLTGSMLLQGYTNLGTLAVTEQFITANIGQFITQSSSGANATVRSNVASSSTVLIELTNGSFINGSGNIKIGNVFINAYPVSSTFDSRLITANIGDIVTQPSTSATAQITANVQNSVSIPVRYTGGTFTTGSGNIQINAANVNVYPLSLVISTATVGVRANIGDIITQSSTGATATITANIANSTVLPVTFTSGSFSTVSGNITVNSSNISARPASITAQAIVSAEYNSVNQFTFNSTAQSAIVEINDISTGATPTSVVSVGVITGELSSEGTIGFDESKFDQTALQIANGLTIDLNSGWITGQLPAQSINEDIYNFEVAVYKRDYPDYLISRLYTLTILGDLNNRIDWVTPSDLGTIENGRISDLFVYAVSTEGKSLTYELTAGAAQRFPQGTKLTSTGLLSGRVSFELFSLDRGTTILDGDVRDKGTTVFDCTFTFNITATDISRSISANRTFTITVIQRNITPYEDLYLTALPTREQRSQFNAIIQDTDTFPLHLIYRNEDPFFGLATDIKSLFIPGLTPSSLAEYAAAVATNHFDKRILLGEVKTAVVVDSNFNIKYEVVYVEVFDENTNEFGKAPAQILYPQITNPYYDADGNTYTTAYPNSFNIMQDIIISAIGYANKGALPDWMTSKQLNGNILGFTRAVVLAYTIPGASSLIAYRFKQKNLNLNTINFTIDRYELDNSYSANYDVDAEAFITSTETTFDRYPSLNSVYTAVGTVNYAVDLSFENINNRAVSSIIRAGGLDGITYFRDGETLVFFQQEFNQGQNDIGDYNQGWNDISSVWGTGEWDSNSGTITIIDDIGWDASAYIPGYNENNINPLIANQRAGVWRIDIDSEDIVTLTYIQAIAIYNSVFVKNGYTRGATNIYLDPVIKPNNLIPNYSIIQEQISIVSTQFDGNGTTFYDYRDSYTVPTSMDKYIKFSKLGVFN